MPVGPHWWACLALWRSLLGCEYANFGIMALYRDATLEDLWEAVLQVPTRIPLNRSWKGSTLHLH